MIVLIPAYQPDARFIRLVRDLRGAAPDLHVVAVDDGSGADYDPVFASVAAAGADVLRYPVNRGKGYALRSGLAYIRGHLPGREVVCADCDGQHSILDILRVAARVRSEPGAIVLGSRRFTGQVPARSRFGNAVSRASFKAATGTAVYDTQTGLRGFGPELVDWLLTIGGDRYEYELRVLLEATRAGVRLVEVDIATIYLDGNSSSHFRPIHDSVRIYAPLLMFAASSLLGVGVDWLMLLVLNLVTGSLLVCVVGARVASAGVNFAVNRTVVFGKGKRTSLSASLARYAVLAIGLLAASYGILRLLTEVGVPLVAAKLIADVALFFVSFAVQRRFVFARPDGVANVAGRRPEPEVENATDAGVEVEGIELEASYSEVGELASGAEVEGFGEWPQTCGKPTQFCTIAPHGPGTA